MITAGRDRCIGRLSQAAAFLARVEIDVVKSSVEVVIDFGVGSEAGRESLVVDPAIGPLCMPRVVLQVRTQFPIARHGRGQAIKCIGAGWWHRSGVGCIPNVGSEHLYFTRAQCVGSTIRNIADTAVHVKRTIGATCAGRVVHQPRTHVETVVLTVNIRLAGRVQANGIVDFIRTDIEGNPQGRDASRLLSVPSNGKVDHVVGIATFDVGEQATMNRPRTIVAGKCGARDKLAAGRQIPSGRKIVLSRQRALPKIVEAGGAARRLADTLDCRHQQANENSDDGDHHQ